MIKNAGILQPQPNDPASHTLLTQFFVGQRARALSLGCVRVPAVVTLGDLPYVDVHRHSLGFVKRH